MAVSNLSYSRPYNWLSWSVEWKWVINECISIPILTTYSPTVNRWNKEERCSYSAGTNLSNRWKRSTTTARHKAMPTGPGLPIPCVLFSRDAHIRSYISELDDDRSVIARERWMSQYLKVVWFSYTIQHTLQQPSIVPLYNTNQPRDFRRLVCLIGRGIPYIDARARERVCDARVKSSSSSSALAIAGN